MFGLIESTKMTRPARTQGAGMKLRREEGKTSRGEAIEAEGVEEESLGREGQCLQRVPGKQLLRAIIRIWKTMKRTNGGKQSKSNQAKMSLRRNKRICSNLRFL